MRRVRVASAIPPVRRGSTDEVGRLRSEAIGGAFDSSASLVHGKFVFGDGLAGAAAKQLCRAAELGHGDWQFHRQLMAVQLNTFNLAQSVRGEVTLPTVWTTDDGNPSDEELRFSPGVASRHSTDTRALFAAHIASSRLHGFHAVTVWQCFL